MKTIKDSVHDHIDVDGVALALLDTPPVQRLRHVSQLGTASLVYPSANHTRFEHSLGVYHLADRALEHLGVAGQEAERVRAAAMIHDVGHGPFSHTLEGIVRRRTGEAHDDIGGLLAGTAIVDVLEDHDLDPSAVVALVAGEGRLGQVIAGELDVDRMDYLARDAHHTGVPYGTVDHGRLVRSLGFFEGDLVLGADSVRTAESLLLARALMNPTVYNHHVARIGTAMLRAGARRLLETTGRTATDLRRMDDHDLLVALRDRSATAAIGRRLTERDLYKRAIWAGREAVPAAVIDADRDAIDGFEAAIADRAGVDPAAVLVDVPDRLPMVEGSARILLEDRVERLAAYSALVGALEDARDEQWRLGVYAPSGATDAVGRAAEAVLDLDLDGARVSETPHALNATIDEFQESG
ncbi:MAG: HD domain-containing protein [Halococcoides sp.]